MEYTVRKLPSGFWAVFAGDEWINAAQPTQEAALALAGQLKEEAAPLDCPIYFTSKEEFP